jgi:hypothetical protein
LALNGDSVDQLRTTDRVYVASDAFDVVVVILALVVVHRMTGRMDAAHAAESGGWDAPERPLGSPAGAVSQ